MSLKGRGQIMLQDLHQRTRRHKKFAISKKGYTAPCLSVIWIIAGTIIRYDELRITEPTIKIMLHLISRVFNLQHLRRSRHVSAALSVVSTVVCLVLAFPMALILRKRSCKQVLYYLYSYFLCG